MAASSAGRFRLIERVAAGGMGEVWRGVDVGAGGVERPVAVKRIAPELQRHPDFVRSFVDEARLSFQLCHANVVQVRDIGCEPGDCFIAMEWVEGADLATLLERCRAMHQPLPLRFAVLITVCAAGGLDYAHRLRSASGEPLHLVHRDVSPNNLLLSVEGEVKVTDFGIARFRERETISVPGALKGKLGYMAPEQARGEELDARADVFALGVVLYEMLTGRNPFVADEGAREIDVLDRLRRGECAPPGRLVQLPAGLEAIVLRAMAPELPARYVSCAALREDLESLARREAWSLSPAALGQFVRSVMSEGEALAETARSPELAKRRAQPTPPKPFDAALGAELAALGGADTPRATIFAKRSIAPASEPASPPRTVAAHQVIPASPPPAPPKGASELTSVVPRGGRLRWVVAALVLGSAVVAAFELRAPTARPTAAIAPPTAASAQAAAKPAPIAAAAQPTAPIAPPTAPTAATAAPIEPHATPLHPHHFHHARAVEPARLTVASDVRANVYVDGKFVHEAPLTDWPLAAGSHRVRVEGSSAGLRLLPKEQTVILKEGEPRRIELDLMRSP